MTLLRYFQKSSRGYLSDPTGLLSSSLSSSAIEEANTAVSNVRELEQGTVSKRKKGPYLKLNDETQARIGKYAGEHGDSAAAKHFTKLEPSEN